jgi:hypothetical protein
MRNAKKVSMMLLALSVATVVVSATRALALPPIQPICGSRICPDNIAPVICPNGKEYINSCYAAQACQKNCVPDPGGF